MVDIIARSIRSLDRIERVRLQQTSMVAEVQRINGGLAGNNYRQPQLLYARLSKVEFPQFNGDSDWKNETKKLMIKVMYLTLKKKPKQEGSVKNIINCLSI